MKERSEPAHYKESTVKKFEKKKNFMIYNHNIFSFFKSTLIYLVQITYFEFLMIKSISFIVLKPTIFLQCTN